MKKWRDWLSGSAHAETFTLPIDLASPDFFADPAPTYKWLRKNHPIAPVKGGGFVLSRYADVAAAHSNPALGNAPSRFSALNTKNKAKYIAADLVSHIPPFLDKPDHIPVRQNLSSAFYSAFEHAQHYVPDMAQACVTRHRGTTVDVIADIARPFACSVMARFIGLDATQAEMKTATNAFFRLFAPISDPTVFQTTNTALQTARDMIQSSKMDAAESLMSAMRQMDVPEAITKDNALLILADGVENIEAACAMVFRDTQVNEVDLSTPSAMKASVLEGLRLSSPAQVLPRVARQDLQLQGTVIRAGTPVFLALGSANLDPDAFAQPTVFQADRAQSPLLVFGKGRHSCIGAQLAVLQIQSLIKALTDCGARLSDPVTPFEWQHRFGHRWPVSLSVQIP